MIKTILPGTGNTGGIMTPLIHFDMIFDTDVGLLCLILKDYMNPEVFNKDFFFNKNLNELVYELYIRKEKNPLNLCINEKYRDKADSFYKQFMKERYDDIFKLSVFTEFYRLIRAFQNESEIKVTIVCDNETQLKYLSMCGNTAKCDSILSNPSESSLKLYNQYFFKSIDSSIPFIKYISNKTVYFANYGFNRNEDGDIIDHDAIYELGDTNVITLIDVYNMSKFKGGSSNGNK